MFSISAQQASRAPGRPRRPWWAVALVVTGVGFVVVEAIVAARWSAPPYSYVHNFVSDLGNPQVGAFDGWFIDSPWATVMNIGFVAHGALFAGGTLGLARRLRGTTRMVFLAAASSEAAGFIVVGLVPSSPATATDGTLIVHYIAAGFGILGGNAAVIIAGRAWRRLSLPRWAGRAGAGLGIVGAVTVLAWMAVFTLVPPGIPERVAIYTVVAWVTLAGVTVRAGSRPSVASAATA